MTHTNSHIVLVPASHVSKQSEHLVKSTISEIQPDAICLELDSARYSLLTASDRGTSESESESESDITLSIPDMIRTHGITTTVMSTVLSTAQQKVVDRLDIDISGVDMLAGHEAATANDIPVILIDRPLEKTFQSFRSQTSFRELGKLGVNLVWSQIQMRFHSDEELSTLTTVEEIPIDTIVEELSIQFPSFSTAFLTERNQYMHSQLETLIDNFDTIVVVIGAAHCPGIKKELSTSNIQHTIVSEDSVSALNESVYSD
jgi:pheromone shutdown protein TraB